MTDRTLVDRLLRTRGSAVISAYLGLPNDPTEQRGVPIRLEEQLYQAGIDPRAAPALRRDADTIRDAVAGLYDTLRNGVALFVSGEIGLFEQVWLPRIVPDRVIVGQRPYVRPLLATQQRCPRYCAVVTDHQHSTLLIASADGLWESDHLVSPGVRKPNFAGWYGLAEYTVRNRAEGLVRRHHRHTVEAVENALRRNGCELVVVGGSRHSVAEFRTVLPRHLRERLAGSFTTNPRVATPAEVRRDADEVVDRWNRERQRRLLDDIRAHAGTDAARVVSGLTGCLSAVNERAVDLLVVRTHDTAPGVVCDNCDLLAFEERTCAICGTENRPVPDVYEEMVVAVLDSGGTVEQVDSDAPVPGHPVARLRFPVPAGG
ncbi:baeRF10 domain-containing protein [Allosalinactinospora lopnorensis]|uniref:baeRF10 domain-containing protein n=1 Tax=Allosalinactinospora lopnorensis TaxID=1352348 RepID=UPI000623D1AD|nr:hypothetical protein [Allosalinactinospora lopnorensis]